MSENACAVAERDEEVAAEVAATMTMPAPEVVAASVIVNLMPAYAEAPVSPWLVRRGVDAFCERVRALAASESGVVVLVPEGDGLVGELEARLADVARVVACDASLGFAFGNESAVLSLLDGARLLPDGAAGTHEGCRVVSAAELLAADGRRWVWFDGASEPVELAAAASPVELAAAAGVMGAKAVYQGFPVCEFFAGDSEAPVGLKSDYVRVYTQANCMAKALSDVCQKSRRETCGRCVFGHEGGHQIATIMADICRKKGKGGDLDLIRDLAPVMERQSLCEQGAAVARAASSCIALFADEIERHYSRKVCAAGECAAFMTYHILPAKCVGCGECVDACEEEAIMGKPRFVHVIDQKACTQCGACMGACEEEAIVMAGADKPRTPPRPIPCKRR